MEQGLPDTAERARLVADQIHRSLVNGAGHPVIDGGGKLPPLEAADGFQGPVRKAADALLNLATCGRLGHLDIDRQRD